MYVTLTKKKLFVMLCLSVIVFLVLIQYFSANAQSIDLSTNAKRVEFIQSLGVKLVNDEYVFKKTVIPNEFGKVYSNYNKLQREANLDLTNFKGKEVTVYTYNCDNERVVNLIVYKDKLIGGDIAETKLNGSMKALKGELNGEGTA